MTVPKTVERITRMRNGEKIKCPKCNEGHISAVGKPEEADVFRCDKCGTSIVMTK